MLTVIGLTSSLSLASATFEQLGSATLSGRHMMVRGYADLVEREAYMKAFPDLAPRLGSVILHELGHNLGADHESTAETLMSATYSRNATGFSADAHAIIQKTLDERIGRAHVELERPPAAERPTSHSKLNLEVTRDGVIVGGRLRDDTELGILFNAQATVDSDTDVVITIRDGGDKKTAADLAARINAAGMKNVRFEGP